VAYPTYRQVTTGSTGHAEAVKIAFDPNVVSFSDILEIFWKSHDPTTLNRQGNDIGSQYRSAIFYSGEEQKHACEKSLEAAQASFVEEIVTEIVPLGEFYVAEEYHQHYFELNPNAGYCQYVIKPKLKKIGLAGSSR
jgi:peptide-methionine (S)-S-oxide reductase